MRGVSKAQNSIKRVTYMFEFFKSRKISALKSTDFGRKNGWNVELNDQVIAKLKNPVFVDMFWYSYDLEIVEAAMSGQLADKFFWDRDGLRFYSLSLDRYFENDVIIQVESGEDGRLTVLFRNLYIESLP